MNADVFIHDKALCESTKIGPGTRIWAFAHVLPGAEIGADCNICDGVFIENDVRIGDRVTIKCGVQLWDATRISDDVFIGPNATFTNTRFPRSKVRPERFLETVVGAGASIGANATILPGLEIGPGAMVGAGAVVIRPVPANAIAVGNPAQIVGYVDAPAPTADREDGRSRRVGIGAVTLHELPVVHDGRGQLSGVEFERTLPFVPRRYLLVSGTPPEDAGGARAHRRCHEFLVCVAGACDVLVDDGVQRRGVTLDRPTVGLHVPPMVWSAPFKHTPDAVVLVLTSAAHDPEDSIRDYGEYLRLVRPSQP
jgi:UDP-2-acetamido-3-amino-2,3-dideoxy-glucuronate N-acetyltransferase